MLLAALNEVEDALRASNPQDVSARFFELLSASGATYLQTRLYRRPTSTLTAATHWAAGGVVARFSPGPWVGTEAFNYVCFVCNPLLGAIRESRTRYRFSDYAPIDDPAHATYWDALSEAGIGDALCATSYGPDRTIASLHLGFDRKDLDTHQIRRVQMAGLLLTERLMEFAVPANDLVELSARERDCLAFVADGRTDWEIAMLLGISESTTRFHLNNARRKLGAVNRSQAVARFAIRGML